MSICWDPLPAKDYSIIVVGIFKIHINGKKCVFWNFLPLSHAHHVCDVLVKKLGFDDIYENLTISTIILVGTVDPLEETASVLHAAMVIRKNVFLFVKANIRNRWNNAANVIKHFKQLSALASICVGRNGIRVYLKVTKCFAITWCRRRNILKGFLVVHQKRAVS